MRTMNALKASSRSVFNTSISPRCPRKFSTYLVKPVELNAALQSTASPPSNIVPLCAAWFLPNDPNKRSGIETFTNSRIPGARFFDLDAISDKSSPYPHMLPDRSTFESAMRSLGIRNKDKVIVYDSAELGIFSAPRIAWTLSVLGHDKVHVLDNFRTWVAEGYPLDHDPVPDIQQSKYVAPETDLSRVVQYGEMLDIVNQQRTGGTARAVQIIDARPHGRWAGTAPEPRPGLSNGHIPGSISLPFTDVLDADTKTYKSKHDLIKLFEQKGIDPSRPIITSCGSGTTAAAIGTALEVAGYDAPRLYDGSWTEWAQRCSKDMIDKA